MGKRTSNNRARHWPRASLAFFLVITSVLAAIFQGVLPNALPLVHAQTASDVGAIAPSTNWGPFVGTYGDVQVNINKSGIAVCVEIPREFLQGVISSENDTHFIQSDIRNDYYYYSVVDESNHWTYDWHGSPSDGPCFKPNFSLRDPNAPWCVEIWNYLNDPNYKAPVTGIDYCKVPHQYVFSCFQPTKFIRFRRLTSPSVAGIYNFTLFVANETNSLGYPDFVHAWKTTLFVPVSMSDDPASITGYICDADVPSPPPCTRILHDKGVVYARNVNTGWIARAYVNQNDGSFNLTGLAPGDYLVQGSAGLVNGVAYSLSDPVSTNGLLNGDKRVVTLFLPRAPQVCGSISYEASPGTFRDTFHSFSDNTNLITAFGPGSDQRIKLNITVEATDLQGHVFRFVGTSSNSSSDSFFIITGSNITFVGTDPYGTEFAGLPPVSYGSYSLTVNTYVAGYVKEYSDNQVQVSSAPGTTIPTKCGDSGTNSVSPKVSALLMGGLITGTIELRSCENCAAETPNQAKHELGLDSVTEPLFGGNILIEAYDYSSGILEGVAVNGTTPTLSVDVSSIRFYVIGFSEYGNHTRSGVWNEPDYGLPEGQYYLEVFIRGYEQASSPIFGVPQGGVSNGGNIIVPMVRGGVFQVGVGSYNNRFGLGCVIQAQQPWRFLNLSIPVRARVYFYDSGGILVGFNETLMETKVSHGVGRLSFNVLFTGQNWSTREIWFYGFVPTHITNDTYTIKGFTLGYVQCSPVTAPNDLAGFVRSFVPLLIANNINMTAARDDLSNFPEHDHAIGDVSFSSDGLAGAIPANVSANAQILFLPIYGFGAWTNITCVHALCKSSFLGQGHFFYVSPEGSRYFDYGIDIGNYTAQIPEFGFNFHFMLPVSAPLVSFSDLSLGKGFVLSLFEMGWVYGLVTGMSVTGTYSYIPLSWVEVSASNVSITTWVWTLDGEYGSFDGGVAFDGGVGGLFLPGGSGDTSATYTITFSNPSYKSPLPVNVTVTWGNGTPEDATLCPIGASCTSQTSTPPTLALGPAIPAIQSFLSSAPTQVSILVAVISVCAPQQRSSEVVIRREPEN